jgi:alanyl-tRNA synthetase
VADLLRVPLADVPGRVEKLLDERRDAEREIERLRSAQRGEASRDLTSSARDVDGVRVIASKVDGVGAKELRSLVDDLRARLGSGVVLLASENEGRVSLALGVTADLTSRYRAGDLVREVAQVVGGRGGGRPDFAQAGGDDASKLDAAFERFDALIAGG